MGQVLAMFPEVAGDRLDSRGYDIPVKTVEALERYVFDSRSPGAFLTAVLSNDLQMAVIYADDDNLAALKPICQFVFNRLPSVCWGSETAVELHLKQGLQV